MCLKPITLRNKSSPYKSVHSIQVPCGKCVECLQSYQNSWFVRFYYEFLDHDKAVFFTLTYNNESVPTLVDDDGVVYYTVYKQHLQSWIKRLRTRTDKKFKYFITSEYGPKTFRPHYHGVFFGLSKNDIFTTLIDWQNTFGFTQSRDVLLSDSADVVNTSRYIAKYCSKQEFEYSESSKKVYPTFHLISKGLGVSYVDKNKYFILKNKDIESIISRSELNLNGYKYQLPRYYKDKIYGQKTRLRIKLSDYLVKRNDELHNAQLSQIQSENSHDSAYRIYDMQNRHADSSKTSKFTERHVRFYNKSKL